MRAREQSTRLEQLAAGVGEQWTLDTTGEYLVIGRGKRRRKKEEDSKIIAAWELFVSYAWFLYEHREEILSTERMFLTPVPLKNELAYTGTSGFSNPTIGVYLEWWESCNGAKTVNEQGEEVLMVSISGSPLTGANSCQMVTRDGRVEKIWVKGYGNYWQSFIRINMKYSEKKDLCKPYTLEKLIERLQSKWYQRILPFL
ncbi:MAG: hypothetical protein IKW98_03665 [Prevotella sp.]|nr:hypothetical protein [Prevotella sp.]